ncbi:sigma-54 dependent transcriptional regulator [Ideonella azotifigens]|uniref:Sigma-54 dependent transcriptional regulator n=1 Tax=Ideonella azotifigens TaxID=513160 RepID=A0ABN1JHX4_9BURK|nr:sigma-54 dependent transcriptional regulator [Ideonella azotifigens]MCD2343558.1 sigma-54 dependent transcriptional regulator [Ideonella azotifigens]
MTPSTVLIVDDEAHMRRVLEIMLRQLGHRALVAVDGRQALELLEHEHVDLILTDLRMPVLDGIGLLEEMTARQLSVPTIVMTAQGSIETAVKALKLGAHDYLLRPVDLDVLELAMQRVLSREKLRVQHDFLREQAGRPVSGFFGRSAAMASVFEQIRQVGPTRASVLITGETGTGKEVAAHAIHQASDRAGELFVAVNCAALPADMVEAELFGYEKGSFTGAAKDRVGKFELSSRGTIFLDEITEMPIALQSKLLRVLQEGRVERLGSNHSMALDLRVIAACNRDPREAIRAGRLREDLYYRLNVFSLALPPLRERTEDIEGLVGHLAARQGRRIRVSPEALACLQGYAWPGNVRELDNVVQRALVLGRGEQLEVQHLPADLTRRTAAAAPPTADEPLAETLDLRSAVEALEQRLIARALLATHDNKRQAAAKLGISERALWYKLGRGKSAEVDPTD